MADKIIGEDHGDHPRSRNARTDRAVKGPSGDRLLIFVSGLAYKFAKYREEGRARHHASRRISNMMRIYQLWMRMVIT
jgi:hypothetical protein